MGKRLRIAVNTRLLQPGKLEGIGWFTYETFKRIVKKHPEHDFIFLFDRPYDDIFRFGDNVDCVKLGPPARHPLLYRIWFNYSVPRMLNKHRADVFISPDGYLSLRTDVKQIAVMHDLNFEHFPEDLPKVHRDYYLKFFPRYARLADRIITVSEFSKNDIHEQYGVDLERIDVAYNGVSIAFHPEESEPAEHPFFLSVGSLQPRKNIARLLQAFEIFCGKTEERIDLLLIGDPFFWDRKMRSALDSMTFKDRVHFTGWMERDELRQAYSSAIALAYVSYFEGFGIPLIEAMRCGCPVLTANASCLPEIAGDAALYCDPFNINDIADKLQQLASDGELRRKLIAAGNERSKQFSWEQTADRVWESIQKTING